MKPEIFEFDAMEGSGVIAFGMLSVIVLILAGMSWLAWGY